LAVTHLLFGAIVFGCLTCNEITLFKTRSAANADWYDIEVFYRKMIRWAMKCQRNIRTSVLYAVSGCSTVQSLVLKKCVRYFDKLSAESEPRFVNLVYQSIVEQSISVNELGMNMFNFWPNFLASNPDFTVSVDGIYDLFRTTAIADV
jgi:hypothetical protein